MTVYVIPRGADQADDLIAQLTSFGEHVVNAAPEYKWAETWAAKLLIAEADEIVCLPHWENYGFGQRDRELAVAVHKPMYCAHRDGDKHGALWRLEYEEDEESVANEGEGEVNEEQILAPQKHIGAYLKVGECKGWAESDLEHAAHQRNDAIAVAVAELSTAARERDEAIAMAEECRATLKDAKDLLSAAWARYDDAEDALTAAVVGS